MAQAHLIYLYVWSGDALQARALAEARFPEAEIRPITHASWRAAGNAARLRLLRSLRGRALVFFFASLDGLRYGRILECLHLLHGCRQTVLCDSSGRWQASGTGRVIKALPGILGSLLRDSGTLAAWFVYLNLLRLVARPVAFRSLAGGAELAYLIPLPAGVGANGGAISHIRGFLSALQESGAGCHVFSATPLAQDAYKTEVIAAPAKPRFLWQAGFLAYNLVFARAVRRKLAESRPNAFYQRHTRFSIAGALLSRWMGVPLLLEYNGPEVWIASHWDPSPFRRFIALCEEVSLRSAARILVVSQVLKDDLVARGFSPERIRVNTNGVDVNTFRPGPQRAACREALGVHDGEVLVGFAGSFSLWHGVEVLQQAIFQLLSGTQPCPLRFVLIGDGLLLGEMRGALAAWERTGEVIFTGALASAKVVGFLDACDILVSPHIPMPDGSRFFGSPTKVFEYMAMDKAIVASRLEQLAEVLSHDRTAWLVSPGDAQELAQAIAQLARDPKKRKALGALARQTAVEHHSWQRNVAIALGSDANNLLHQAPGVVDSRPSLA